jgi:hypothetical protein
MLRALRLLLHIALPLPAAAPCTYHLHTTALLAAAAAGSAPSPYSVPKASTLHSSPPLLTPALLPPANLHLGHHLQRPAIPSLSPFPPHVCLFPFHALLLLLMMMRRMKGVVEMSAPIIL